MTSPYPARRRRAVQLLGTRPHADEILSFYIGLLELQEPLWRDGPVPRRAQPDTDGPDSLPGPTEADPRDELGFRFGNDPRGELDDAFRGFLQGLADIAPAPVGASATRLVEAEATTRTSLLQTWTAEGRFSDAPGSEPAEERLHLLARAFAQPVAERRVGGLVEEEVTHGPGGCPRCGHPPQVAAIRDAPDALGRRYLVCSLCASWWAFPRSSCAACGESDAERLMHHVDESAPHLRVEECTACSRYLKAVDLRKQGDANPLVDDVASVELDLWAVERGLAKIRVNLVGL